MTLCAFTELHRGVDGKVDLDVTISVHGLPNRRDSRSLAGRICSEVEAVVNSIHYRDEDPGQAIPGKE